MPDLACKQVIGPDEPHAELGAITPGQSCNYRLAAPPVCIRRPVWPEKGLCQCLQCFDGKVTPMP
jgi:hypothetical protein